MTPEEIAKKLHDLADRIDKSAEKAFKEECMCYISFEEHAEEVRWVAQEAEDE